MIVQSSACIDFAPAPAFCSVFPPRQCTVAWGALWGCMTHPTAPFVCPESY